MLSEPVARFWGVATLACAGLAALLGGCGSGQPPSAPTGVDGTGSGAGPTAMAAPAYLTGAGDIAWCGTPGAFVTASLLSTLDGPIFTAGDNVQGTGSAAEFNECYDPAWGRFKHRTFPTPGNHDYTTAYAVPYFHYFGEQAGRFGEGYYSYEVGAWHVIALNSNIPAGPSSAQVQWLRMDLAANGTPCTLAYWHHPVFASGVNDNDATMLEAWRVLYAYGADVVVNGHHHMYERFAPQDPGGRPDARRGIRAFVVGTGGAPLTGIGVVKANSEVRDFSSWGVIRFTLRTDGYDWQFLPAGGGAFFDAGSAACVQ